MRRLIYINERGRHMVEVVERAPGQFMAVSRGHIVARGDVLEMRRWLIETGRTYRVATLGDAPTTAMAKGALSSAHSPKGQQRLLSAQSSMILLVCSYVVLLGALAMGVWAR